MGGHPGCVVPNYFVLFVLISLYSGICLSAPTTKDTKAYPCVVSTACQGDDGDSVQTSFKNQTYCCHAGDTIILSVSGDGFQYSKTFYAKTYNLGKRASVKSIGNTVDWDETAVVKRSVDDQEGESSSSVPTTFSCQCKPVDSLNSGIDMDSTFFSSFEANFNEMRNTMDQVFGEDDDDNDDNDNDSESDGDSDTGGL